MFDAAETPTHAPAKPATQTKEQCAAAIRKAMIRLQDLIDDAADKHEMRFTFDVTQYRNDNTNHPILDLKIEVSL